MCGSSNVTHHVLMFNVWIIIMVILAHKYYWTVLSDKKKFDSSWNGFIWHTWTKTCNTQLLIVFDVQMLSIWQTNVRWMRLNLLIMQNNLSTTITFRFVLNIILHTCRLIFKLSHVSLTFWFQPQVWNLRYDFKPCCLVDPSITYIIIHILTNLRRGKNTSQILRHLQSEAFGSSLVSQ